MSISTYLDAIDYVMDEFEVDRGGTAARRARRAVQRAYDVFPDKHRWAYYERPGQVHTLATQATGAVVYDHTGGDYERQLTLSDSTWPEVDDIRLYKVIIGQYQFDIEDVKSTTVATLSATKNPGADVASASSTLYKSRFHLPVNFLEMVTPLMQLSGGQVVEQTDSKDLVEFMYGNYSPQQPRLFAVNNAGEYFGSWLLELAPPPNTARTYDYFYKASPRPLRFDRHNTGTLTTNGTTTVTGTGTAFTSKMVGSILRVPISGTTEPGGLVGGLDDESGNEVEPFDEQRVIVSVEATNSLTLDAAITARAGVGFVISDPLDIVPGTMMRAFLSLCAAEYARLSKAKDRGDWYEQAQRDILEAMAADNTQRDFGMPSGRTDKSKWGLAEWAIAQSYGGSPLT